MFYRRIIGVLGIVGVLGSGSHAKADVIDLPPRSDWTVDYAEDSCALQRDFGSEGEVVHLEFRQFAPDTRMQVLVASPDYALRNVQFVPSVRYSTDGEPHVPQWMLRLAYPGGVRGVQFDDTLRASDDPQRLEANQSQWRGEARVAREQAIEWIEVSDVFRRDFRLVTGRMHAPMEALRTCLDELLTHWGIDAAAHRTLSRPAQAVNFEQLVSAVREAYPREMRGTRDHTRLRIRLDVSAEGRATGCHLQHTLGADGFEQAACAALLENARFSPALDATGNPIASYFLQTIYYS